MGQNAAGSDDAETAAMAVEKWTPERRRALTRGALIDAAAQVFARRGFEGASLDEIAATAGFTRGAIYKNFDGKEELFFAVWNRTIERHLASFAEQFEEFDELAYVDVKQIASIWRSVSVNDPDEFAFHLEFRLYALRNPDVRERFIEHQRRVRELLTEFIEERSRTSGVALRMPAATIAAIGDVTAWACQEAQYLDPDDEDLFERVVEMMIAVSIEPGRAASDDA